MFVCSLFYIEIQFTLLVMTDNRKCFQTHLSTDNCRIYTSICICNPVEQARCALNSAGSAATQFRSYTPILGDKSEHTVDKVNSS